MSIPLDNLMAGSALEFLEPQLLTVQPSVSGTELVPAPPKLLTVQDVLEWVMADPALAKQQRRVESCALRKLARATKLPLAAIRLETDYLNNRVFTLPPNHVGVSKGRWRSICSTCRRVLKRAGIYVVGIRRNNALTDAWHSWLSRIPEKWVRRRLSTFARFCSARGIEPEHVTMAVFAAFEEEERLGTAKDGKKAASTYRSTCRAWNAARKLVAGWPPISVEVPTYNNRFSKPRDNFSQSFWADIEAYAAACSQETADIFDEEAPRRLRPKTLKARRELFWEMASAQVLRGRPIHEIVDLAALVEPTWVKEGLRFFIDRYKKIKSKRLLEFASTMKSVALNWPRRLAPGEKNSRTLVVEQLGRLCGPVDPGTAEFSDKNSETLSQFDDPAKVLKFLLLPHQIWHEMRKRKKPTAEDARLMMAAVAIELLVCTMIRLGNLAAIDMKKHFWSAKPATGAITHLVFEGSEVKNGQPLRLELGANTIALINDFKKRWWRLLANEPTTQLFPLEPDEGKRESCLRYLITSTVDKYLNIQVTPHQFRHIGCKLYIDRNPGDFETLRRILGHRRLETTMRFYARIEASKALNMFTAAVFAERNGVLAKWK